MNTALIFAAGKGERLKPITRNIPKALCPILDIPLIEHHIVNLKKAGFERILINHAYLGDQIKRHVGTGSRFGVEIIYLPEPPGGLETAGTVVYALPYLNNQPFVSVNADIYTDFDFSTLRASSHLKDTAHLVLIPKPATHRQGDFGLNQSWVCNSPRLYTFSGIARYHPQYFANHPLKRFSLTPLLRNWAEQQRITATLYQGLWFDIGTPERLQQVKQKLALINDHHSL